MARILIVDDEPTLVLLMRAVLERAGHTIEEAGNGQEALARLGVEPEDAAAILPDLMLLDVMMPIVDGLTVASTLRDHPRAGRMPILVITAKGDMRALFEAMPQVTGFFHKPFDPKSLREAVLKAVAPK